MGVPPNHPFVHRIFHCKPTNFGKPFEIGIFHHFHHLPFEIGTSILGTPLWQSSISDGTWWPETLRIWILKPIVAIVAGSFSCATIPVIDCLMVQNRVPKPCSALSLESSQLLLFTNHSPLANFFSDKKVGRWTHPVNPKIWPRKTRQPFPDQHLYQSRNIQMAWIWLCHKYSYSYSMNVFLASQISVPS